VRGRGARRLDGQQLLALSGEEKKRRVGAYLDAPRGEEEEGGGVRQVRRGGGCGGGQRWQRHGHGGGDDWSGAELPLEWETGEVRGEADMWDPINSDLNLFQI
jgi:hypothetical protein